MAIIKVTYNSVSRRFNIESSTTWVDLESKLRSLYNIPATSSLTVSYTDEDGDIITLSSDLELKEVISQHLSGQPIKLVLSAVNDWVLEDDNKSSNADVENNLVEDSPQDQTEEKQTTDREEENFESRPPSYYQRVSVSEEEEEPEFEQTTPLLNKEKESVKQNPEEQHPEKTEDTKTRPEKENKEKNDEDDDDDEIIFIISHHPAFFGPRFGPRFGHRFGGFGGFGGFFGGPRFGPFDGLFNPFNFYGRQQFYRPAFSHEPSTYYFNSRQCGPNACGQKSNACNGNSKPSCFSKQQTTSHNNSYAESSTSAAARNNGCDKNNCKRSSRTSCGQNFNYFHPRYYNQTQITQEQLNEKLSTLHSMGFDSSNNALYEDLLKRYNGNLDRVVELLLRNQQINEHYDNEKASISESKKVENEESKPYIL